ncbi:MAG TPA: SDR family oxidoreductase [Ktedonobacterales bacterium]|nr:SDR family oxidoreductase [Ktedonobacterales bacterium]
MDLKNLGLNGKTAIVTGASQGIGREIARALHAEGVALALVSRSRQSAQEAARVIGGSSAAQAAPIHPIVADLSLLAEVERVASEAIARLGHVDILINNAALTTTGAFFEMSDGDLQNVWQVKGMGYVRMTRAIAAHMKERHARRMEGQKAERMQAQEAGRIVNIIGGTARTPALDFLMGSMVNAALVNFTRGVARELGPFNIRVNAISPGVTLTERLLRHYELESVAKKIPVDDLIARDARHIPGRRFVTPEEIAALTVFVVSDLCPALTGEDIVMDGGANPGV